MDVNFQFYKVNQQDVYTFALYHLSKLSSISLFKILFFFIVSNCCKQIRTNYNNNCHNRRRESNNIAKIKNFWKVTETSDYAKGWRALIIVICINGKTFSTKDVLGVFFLFKIRTPLKGSVTGSVYKEQNTFVGNAFALCDQRY